MDTVRPLLVLVGALAVSACADTADQPYGKRPGGPAMPGSEAASAPPAGGGPATSDTPRAGTPGSATHSSGGGTTSTPPSAGRSP